MRRFSTAKRLALLTPVVLLIYYNDEETEAQRDHVTITVVIYIHIYVCIYIYTHTYTHIHTKWNLMSHKNCLRIMVLDV